MNNKKQIMMTVFFLLAVGITIAAGVFCEVNDKERGRFSFQIPEDKKQVLTIDLADQGKLKYYLQPGMISLFGRGKNMLQDAKIYTKFYGVEGFVSQGSKKSSWIELKEDMPLKSGKNKMVPINIEVEIPYTRTRQYEVGRAVLEFWNDHQLVDAIHFQFINSNYTNSTMETAI